MKKNSLATAIVAGVAGVAGMMSVAQAINLNPDGLGQVLLYPYYTVNGGNSTLVTVVNTTDQVKAVKVRFVEALNSAEVLDFNLYLSPFDVWSANVVADGTTGAKLVTSDKSCTVPEVLSGTAFMPWEYTENTPDILAGRGLPRVRQGHLEVIEMGQVVNGTTSGEPRLAAAATHVNGVPRDCGALQDAWESGVWNRDTGNPDDYVLPPSGGLFGAGVIVSAEFGRTLSYNADAIDGFYDSIGGATLHSEPGDVFPNLAQAQNVAAAPNAVRSRIFNNGALHQIDYNLGIDGVSSVFMSRYIYNEYNLNKGLDSASEWVITFPTKRYYVRGAAARQPFTANFPVSGTAAQAAAFPGSCHEYAINYWDREERTTTRRLTVSPPRANPGFELCWEANVLAFGQTLGATTPTRILGVTPAFGAEGLSGFEFDEGWARIEFDVPGAGNPGFQYFLPSQSTASATAVQTLIGQPVAGFWASEVVNNNVAAGVRANFGMTHKHRVSRDCRMHAGTASGASFVYGSVSAAATGCPVL